MKYIKNKRFLFINLSIDDVRIPGVNHGISYLVPILKKHSFDVAVMHLSEETRKDDIVRKIKTFDPAIIGFSATTQEYKFLIKYSKMLEGLPDVLQIGGGVHVTLDPLDVLSRTALHGVCIGEGESPLEDLLNRIEKGDDITGTQGFYWKVAGNVKKNPTPQFIADLSTIEFPDFSVFARDVVVKDWNRDRNLIVQKEDVRKYIVLLLSRGCPYNCPYCCNRARANVYASSEGYYRLFPVGYCIDFIKKILREYPETNFIEFLDDLLLADRRWILSFTKEYKEKIGVPYKLDGRFEHITPDIVKALKESGCVQMIFGLESGNEGLRQKLLKRMPTDEMIIEKSKMIKDAGIELATFNLIGLPFETRSQIMDTVRLNRRMRTDLGTVQFFRPYKSTELYNLCKEQGLLKSEEEMLGIISNFEKPFIKVTGMTEKECILFQKIISFFFFIQLSKYRCGAFLKRTKGLQKAGIVVIIIKLFFKGTKLYYGDYVNKRRKGMCKI